MQPFTSFFLKFHSNLLMERIFFLLNDAFSKTILDFILRLQEKKTPWP